MSNRNVSGSDESSGESHDIKDMQTAGSDKPADAHPGHGPLLSGKTDTETHGHEPNDTKGGHGPGDLPSNTATQTQAFASNDAKGGHGPL